MNLFSSYNTELKNLSNEKWFYIVCSTSIVQ